MHLRSGSSTYTHISWQTGKEAIPQPVSAGSAQALLSDLPLTPSNLQENMDPRKTEQCSEARDLPNSWSNQATEFSIEQRDKRPDEVHLLITVLEGDLAFPFLDSYSLSMQAHSNQPHFLRTNEKLFLIPLISKILYGNSCTI